MTLKFPNKTLYFKDEIRHMNKCNNTVDVVMKDKNYEFSDEHILSSSKNCAYLGNKLKGVVYGSVNGDKLTLNKLWT